MLLLWAFVLLFRSEADPIQPIRYDGYRVFSLNESAIMHDPAKLAFIHDLHDYDRKDVDFWSGVDVSLSPQVQASVLRSFDELGINYYVHIDDVQQHLEEHMLSFDSSDSDVDYFSSYHNWADIQTYMLNLETKYNGAAGGALWVSIQNFDEKTYEGNTIQRMIISGKGGFAPTKQYIYLEACIHAREWIATTSIQYVMDRLLSLYGTDESVTKMVDDFIWVLVPVVNVDGYKYSWAHDRMWRKTRSPNTLCVGTDPNRNWDYHWCESGASRNPCSDSFCGSAAFSEKCVQAVSNWIDANKARVLVFGDMHTYGSMFFGPWGYTCNETPDAYDKQHAFFQPTVDALQRASGEKWLGYGTICKTIYAASGSSADWGYGASGIEFSFGAEMEGNSFSPPASSIRRYAENWWAGIKVMGESALAGLE